MAVKRFSIHMGKTTNYSYIRAPDGANVIRYWFCCFGRLGNSREFNAEFLVGPKRNRLIACAHGGLARALLRYLNGGEMSEIELHQLYDPKTTIPMLNSLRRKHETIL